MKKMSKKVAKIISCLLFFMVVTVFCHGNAFAVNGGGYILEGNFNPTWSGGGSGGNCRQVNGYGSYAVECNGYSWLFFETQVTEGQEIETMFVPDPTSNNKQISQGVMIPKECSAHKSGGFWIFGSNARAISTNRVGYFGSLFFTREYSDYYTPRTNYTYSTSPGSYGHLLTFSYGNGKYDIRENVGSIQQNLYVGNTLVYSATKMDGYPNGRDDANTEGTAWHDFLIAYEYYNGYSYSGNDYPDGVYLFCYWPGMEGSYYGKTSASVTGSDSSDSTTTDIVSMGSKTVAEEATVNIKTDEEATLTFSHDVYSKEPNKTLYVNVNRDDGLRRDGSNYTITSTKLSDSVVSGSVTFGNRKTGNYYLPSSGSGGFSVSGSTILTDSGIKIKFTEEGSYIFCEELKMAEESNEVGSADFTSKACIKVIVGDVSEESGCDPSIECCTGACNDSTGVSKVKSSVKNNNLSGSYAGWHGIEASGDKSADSNKVASEEGENNVIYAKPSDTIKWVNMYSPGAQINWDKNITILNESDLHDANGNSRHGAHSGSNYTSNSYEQFYMAVSGWSNDYHVHTDSPNGLNYDGGVSDITETAPTRTGIVYKKNTYKVKGVDVGETFLDSINTVVEGNKVTPSKSEYKSVAGNAEGHTWQGFDENYYSSCVKEGEEALGEKPSIWQWNNMVTSCAYGATYDLYHNNNVNYGKYEDQLLKSASYVRIPYNFENSASVEISGDNGVVYAGGEVNVDSFNVSVDTVYNSVTEANYATIVRNAKVRLIAYSTIDSGIFVPFSDGVCTVNSCSIVESYDGDLNDGIMNRARENNTLKGTSYNGKTIKNTSFGGPYNVFDVAAGTYFCMAVAVYPSNSYDNEYGPKNMDPKGSDSWYVSSPSCLVVAKKPSFQVWGGSLYSNGKITTNPSVKKVLKDVGGYEYSPKDGTPIVFGSWVEQGVFSNGLVERLASGAATGLVNDARGSGSKETNVSFCSNRVPLSFANNSTEGLSLEICGGGGDGKSGNFNKASIVTNRRALVDYFKNIPCKEKNCINGTYYEDGSGNGSWLFADKISATGMTVQYNDFSGNNNENVSWPNMGVTNGTFVVDADVFKDSETGETKRRNVYIGQNIEKSINANYSSLKQVSQVVIYASGNIVIGCGVTRIDAILIAEGTISTCDNYLATDSSSWNASARQQNQLRINGAVMANNLDLGRTYGNTTGTGSGTPAEVINYDTTSLLWSMFMASPENSDTLTTVYQHELAPRY